VLAWRGEQRRGEEVAHLEYLLNEREGKQKRRESK